MKLVHGNKTFCTYRPALKCKENIVYTNTFGKVFHDDVDLQNELKIYYSIVNKLDKAFYFSLRLNHICHLFCDNKKTNTICRFNENDKQVIYKSSNGYSLQYMINNRILPLKDLLSSFGSLFLAMYQLSRNGYIHQNINPSNIYFNIEDKTMQLLHFNTLSHKKNVYNPEKNDSLKINNNIFLPPEYNHLVKLINNGEKGVYYNNKPAMKQETLLKKLNSLLENLTEKENDKYRSEYDNVLNEINTKRQFMYERNVESFNSDSEKKRNWWSNKSFDSSEISDIMHEDLVSTDKYSNLSLLMNEEYIDYLNSIYSEARLIQKILIKKDNLQQGFQRETLPLLTNNAPTDVFSLGMTLLYTFVNYLETNKDKKDDRVHFIENIKFYDDIAGIILMMIHSNIERRISVLGSCIYYTDVLTDHKMTKGRNEINKLKSKLR